MAKKQSRISTDILFNRQDGEESSQQSDVPAGQRSGDDPMANYLNNPKGKGTYYLSDETLIALDDILPYMKRLAGPERKSINKSLIVEAALQLVLADLEENGDDSGLAQKIKSI